MIRKHHELCDVMITVGARKIYAHKVILAACSPYFRAMFTGAMSESSQTEVTIRSVSTNQNTELLNQSEHLT